MWPGGRCCPFPASVSVLVRVRTSVVFHSTIPGLGHFFVPQWLPGVPGGRADGAVSSRTPSPTAQTLETEVCSFHRVEPLNTRNHFASSSLLSAENHQVL